MKAMERVTTLLPLTLSPRLEQDGSFGNLGFSFSQLKLMLPKSPFALYHSRLPLGKV